MVAVISSRCLQRNPAGHQHGLDLPVVLSLSHKISMPPHALHLESVQIWILGLCCAAGPVISCKAKQGCTAKILDQARARTLEIILAHFRKDALITKGPEHLVQAMCSHGTTLTSEHLNLIEQVRGLAFQT